MTSSNSSITAIEQYVRNYRSALKSTLEVTLHSLISSHLSVNSTLHPLGSNPNLVDVPALSYAFSRLPPEIDQTHKIIIGQEPDTFTQAGVKNILKWTKVYASSRRRCTYYHPDKKILAYFVSSISDIDDLVTTLTAFQIEWNKFHQLAHLHFQTYLSFKKALKQNTLPQILSISQADWSIFLESLGKNSKIRLKHIYYFLLDLRLQLLASSWINYTRTAQKWWKNIATTTAPIFHISHQQIYFISSNTHSILNLTTGFAAKHQDEIIKTIQTQEPHLYRQYLQLKKHDSHLPLSDFINYALKFCRSNHSLIQKFLDYQQHLDIITISNSDYLDIPTQIFPIKNLVKSQHLDPRLHISRPHQLAQSPSLIFNIDYPLGFAAYHLLKEVLENVQKVKGVYILGKAAVLNGEVGDIQIPRLVFDEHSQNSYIFKNCFNSFFPFTNPQGSILTNQKSVSVLGTFLENKALLKTYSENNLTVIEMESGPYLTAVTEASYDTPAPKNTIIDLNNAPFDLGIINYTSDSPFSNLQNLGYGQLGLGGIEPVTLGSLAILQRIINLEENLNK